MAFEEKGTGLTIYIKQRVEQPLKRKESKSKQRRRAVTEWTERNT